MEALRSMMRIEKFNKVEGGCGVIMGPGSIV